MIGRNRMTAIRRWPSAFVVASLMLLAPDLASAGGGPENVVVVVNEGSVSSKLIANHYVALRKIPARNVIYLRGIPNRETTNLEIFQKKILIPILSQIKDRGLGRSVDYIVYSADFPTAITIHEHRKKLLDTIKKQTGSNKVPNATIYNATASINALTYYSAAVLAGEAGYLSLDSNSYYRKPASLILRTPFVGPQQQRYVAAVRAFEKGPGEEFDEAIGTLEDLANVNSTQVAVCYWLARFYATKGDVRSTVNWLSQAIRNGWVYRGVTQEDPAFEKVRLNALFRGLEQRMPDQPFEFLTSRGFKHSRAWALNGMVNQEPGQGNNLMLSTVLAVTRNFGTTEEEALRQLQASVSADETNPQGTFYFSVAGGVRNTTRKSQIAPAMTALRSLGKRAETIDKILPNEAQDIAGLFTGSAKFKLDGTGNRILPGAICDHLTSFGGRLAAPGQTKLSEFVRYGAAGASGTVTEPYAIAAKFPHAMMHVHYARGCSLAESFYQSVYGPFQLLIVGDALCQPYAVRPKVSVKGIIDGQTVVGQVSIEPDVSRSKVPVSMMELYVDGVLFYRSHELKPLDFDTSRLTDGYHELRLVVTAKGLIESNGHCIVPFNVNNHGHQVELTCNREAWNESGNVLFTVDSNFGDQIDIVQNMRSLGQAKGQHAEISIPAKALGRGPVRVEAIATSTETKLVVGSSPVNITIEGVVSATRVNTEKPKPRPPKK